MKNLYTLFASLVIAANITAAPRNLVVVNGLGETLDKINLEDSTVTHNVDVLGLYPNDFVTSGNYGVEVNSGSNDLYFYNMNTMSRTGNCFLGNSRNPYNAAFLVPETLYVTNLVSSTIAKINVVNRTVINEFPVGDAVDSDSPQGIVIQGRRAFVCLTSFNELFEYDSGKLEIWDLNADTLIKRVTIGINPQVARFGYDGYLYILCTGNYANVEGRLFKFDPDNLSLVDSLEIGGFPGGLAITKQGVAFIAAGGWPPPVRIDKNGRHYVDRFESGQPEQRGSGIIYTVNLNSFQVLHGEANPIYGDWGITNVMTISDSTVATTNFADDTVTEIDSAGVVHARFSVGDGPLALAKWPACFVVKGDADTSGLITISDAVFLIGYIFAGGPAPQVNGCGDMDCNSLVTISDAVAVITYIFVGGPGSCGCAD